MIPLCKIFFTSLLIVIVSVSQQDTLQTKVPIEIITLSTLFKLHDLDQDKIEDLIISKGYVFRNVQVLNSDNKAIHYVTKKPANIYHSISIFYFKGEIVETSFTTSSQEEYVNFKRQIKAKGYSFNFTENTTYGATINQYSSDNPIYVIRTTQSYGRETKEVQYIVEVTNILSDRGY